MRMNLSSTDFESNGNIPEKFTCDGDNINPHLSFSDIPKNAQSLALIVNDPDAPSGDFVHWIMWNIDPTITEIMQGTTPMSAVEGQNDTGEPGWTGPCPPSGTHHYEFHLFALNQKLDLPDEADKHEFREALEGAIIEEAILVGLYKRVQ